MPELLLFLCVLPEKACGIVSRKHYLPTVAVESTSEKAAMMKKTVRKAEPQMLIVLLLPPADVDSRFFPFQFQKIFKQFSNFSSGLELLEYPASSIRNLFLYFPTMKKSPKAYSIE